MLPPLRPWDRKESDTTEGLNWTEKAGVDKRVNINQ